MTLFYVGSDEPIGSIPHPETWQLIQERLPQEARQKIETELDRVFESDEIHTAGWIPGSDWSNTPWDPIYQLAALQSQQLSGLMFGLLFFEHAMRRDENWFVGRFSLNGEELRSLTYFRPQP